MLALIDFTDHIVIEPKNIAMEKQFDKDIAMNTNLTVSEIYKKDTGDNKIKC